MSVQNPVIASIDPVARLIYLAPGVRSYHPVDDIYKEVRTLRRLDESLRPYDMFVSAGGNVKKLADGSLRTPRYAIFNNCKVVPDVTASHDLTITGEQLFAPGFGAEPTGTGPAAIDKTPLPNGIDVNVDYRPSEAEVIIVGGSNPLANVLEGALTVEDALRVILSAVAGKGGPDQNGTFRYRDLADTKDRIVADVDQGGNRTSIAVDGSE